MVLVKNLPTNTINTLQNFGGEILYDSTINRPIVNISSGFNKFVLSNLNNEVSGLSALSATNLTGTLQTAAQPNITSLGTLTSLTSNGDVTIASHNGSTTGLILGSTLVTATGTELNYVDTTPGTAQANKALVTDENNSIVGLTNLETDNLTVNGTLVTASAIELNYTDVTTIGVAQASKALVVDENLDIVGIHNIETDNLTVNGTLVTASAIELNYTDVSTIGTADASKALVVDANKDIGGIRNLSAENLTGTLQTAAQPNITSVGTLTNLDVAGQLTVSGLEISGVPLTPSDVGGIRVRVFSSNDFNGRIIKNDIVNNVDFTDYVPSLQSENYSMEVWGYIKPLYSENYTFVVTSNDHFRLWINNELVKTQWVTGTHTSLQTDPISLTANVWYPIYIQHRQDTGTQSLRLVWESTSQTSETIPQSAFAFDNREVPISTREIYAQDSLTLYDITNGYQSSLIVNSSGDLSLTSHSDNIDILGHDGSTKGLKLDGTLVTSTATELNYVDTTPGTIEASKALVVDSNRDITNINNITSTGNLILSGTAEVNDITDASSSTTGALTIAGGVGIAKKLYVGDDLDVTDNVNIGGDLTVTGPILAIPTGDTASRPNPASGGYIRYNTQTSQFEGYGAGNAWGSLGGVSDVNQDTKILAEDGAGTNDDNLRFFNNGAETMRLTSTGLLGLGTNAPDKQLEINSTTGDCLRLTYNDANGSATNYTDFSVSNSGNLTINTSGNTVFIDASDNLDIASHDSSTIGLKLGGTLITSSATEINYLDLTTGPGTAEANKALVLDVNRDIENINELSASIINATIDNATGNSVVYPITVNRNTTTTPANGLGAGIEFYIENSNNDNVAYGSIEISADDITDNSEDGKLKINLMTAGLSTTALTLTKESLLVEELVETSDRRVKENIEKANLEESYDKIMQLDLVDYNFIHDKEKRKHRGLIAQDLKEIIPNAVHVGENEGIKDFHSVSSKELLGYMIGALQHMNKKYDLLEKKYIELESKYNELKYN
jgi:hypothetical protein